MKKFTFLLITLLFSLIGYSQFPTPGTEGFESTTGPDLPTPVAMSPWTLGTGAAGNQWAVFDNGVPAPAAGQRRWTSNTINFYSGTQSAFINRKQNGALGNISEDYLATPKVTVPANGQLTFWTRVGFNSPDVVSYQIKVNTNTTTAGSQTTRANYTTIQTWDQTNIADPTNITTWVQKTVDLSAYPAGTPVYLAFVRVFNQPSATLGGNSWYVDEVKLVQQCVGATAQGPVLPTTTTASLAWTPANPAATWEIEVVPVTSTPTGVGVIYNGASPYTATNLIPGTGYVFYIRKQCTDSNSTWLGPYNFTTVQAGLTCAGPITIGSLPYSVTDNTSNYGDTYDVTQPTTCAGGGTNYMQGNDVFYSYTAATTGAISISMTPTGTNSSIFVYQGCSSVGVSCLAGVANTTGAVRTIASLNVTAGQTYTIVLSSSATTQTYPYSLLIQQLNCPPPTGLGASPITATNATLSWVTPATTSWEYFVQPLNASIPTTSGITSASSSVMVSTLNSGAALIPGTDYQYWVRADCGNGTFSPWTGPYVFRMAPGCGGLFVDSGGQSGNYANSTTAAAGTTTICPTNAGDQVTVTFTSLSTEANNDVLKVYNGSGTGGLVLGTYSGTYTTATLPHITSSSSDGCLTFVFTSNATTNLPGWVANVTCAPAPACQQPILLTTGAVTYDSVPVGWTQPNNSDGSQASSWDVIAVPCGDPAPTATTTGYLSTSSTATPPSPPFTYPGLLPLKCYDFYVRATCSSTNASAWSGPVSATTAVAPPICGGNFVDSGGTTGNYSSNETISTTITPVNSGDQVTVNFTSFNTQPGVDLLKVYDGTDTSATGTLLATYSGIYTGAALPSITSSAPGGELTFVFTSSATVNAPGWIANVTCAPAPDCQKPILLIERSADTAYNQVGLSWSQTQNPDFTFPVLWQVIALPSPSTPPTDLTPLTDGYQTSDNINYIYPGLNPLTCYDFYVRSLCTGTSLWCGPTKVCTLIAPAICGGNYVDSGIIAGNYSNNENIPTHITTTPGNQVTVKFNSFNTQAGFDLMKVYDGADTSPTGTLLATYSGLYTGTALPKITSSAPNGDLTFVFTSNATVTASGWLADIICDPAPACQKPILLNAPPATIAYNQVGLAWSQTQNPDGSTPTQWEVLAVQCNGTPPAANAPIGIGQSTPTTSTLPQLTYTGLNSTVCYDFYVRAICSSSSTSAWTGPISVTTALGCGGVFTDAGGAAGNYPNNVNAAAGTTIITTTPGTQVTVTFTTLNTELNTDLLKVYDGTDTSPTTGTLLATYSGVYTGTALPQITSSAPNGALSFVFTSSSATNAPGWVANVTCNPSPACQKPILLKTPPATVLAHSVTVTWTQTQNPDGTTPTQWEVYAVPCNTTPPSNTLPISSVGQQTSANSSPSLNYIGLSGETCYDFYVRALCSTTSASAWTGPVSATTAIACPKPTGVIANSNSISTATISWTPGGSETQWQMLCLPANSPPPTASSTGWQNATISTGTLYTGLSVGQFYDVYVRAICSSIDTSTPSAPTSLYIYPPLPSCAGVDLHLATNTPGVYNLCPGSCLNLAATYERTYTTSAYTVSATPFAPLFPFTGGTQVSVNIDDVWSGDVAIPFKFCFYGNTYNTLNIGSNGAVTFNTHTSGSNCPWAYTATIPSTTFPILNAIYAPYQDINPSVLTPPAQPNVNYQVLGTAPCRVMVINFSQIGQFSCGVSVGLQTSQVVLYETSNVIDINIKDRTACTTWNSGSGVVGIQNAAGTNAVVPPGRNTGTWSATNEAWRFLPAGASNVTFSWLQDGATLTTNTDTTICPTANTTLTAEAKYTACDGTVVTKSESVLLNIVSQVTPVFTQIGPLCQGSTAPILPLSSNDTPAITGTWSPATINTSTPGTLPYTFTPDAGQCANPITMNITILPLVVPTFIDPAPICINTPAPVLPTSSNNTPTPITGTWPPVSNTASGTYTFTPDSGQCATTATVTVTVNPNCAFDSYASAVWLSNCSTSNFFNTVGSGTSIIGPVANVFPASNLGTYVQNSGSLLLKGGELKTFKNSSSNVCSANLNYRIYQGAATGTFQTINLPFFSDCGGSGQFNVGGGPCSAGDQKWQKVLPNALYPTEFPIDLTATPPGNYSIQVYYDITGSATSTTGCDETKLIDNNGAYFTATFTIQAQPTYTSTNPTTCGGTNGNITIYGLATNTSYALTYNDGSTVVGPTNVTSDSDGLIQINGLNAGTYSNFLLTINGCSYPYTTPIVLVDPALPTVTVNSPSVCTGQSATIAATTVSGGTYSYAWTVPTPQNNPGNIASFSANTAGTYSVIITDLVTGCSSASGSGTLTINSVIVPTFSPIAPICKGTPAPLLPTSSNNTPTAITGSWLPTVIDNMASAPYVFTPDTGQCSQPITINVVVNSAPTPTATIVTQPTCTTPTGTVDVTPHSSLGSIIPTDLFISEVTDSNAGSLSYIELYNGTGASINLSNYTIKTANNGNSTYTFTLPLNNVTLATGATYVVALGNDSACSSTPGGDGSYAAQTNPSGSVNFAANGNDQFSLFNGTTKIDSWGVYGSNNWAPSSIGLEGADFRRKTTVTVPNTTYDNNDWDIIDYAGSGNVDCANNDYSNIGVYSYPVASTYQYNVDGGTYVSNSTFSGLTPGSHVFTIKDMTTGCISDPVSVTLNQPVSNLTVSVNNPTVCQGTNAIITAVPSPSGTYNYTWTYPQGASNPGNVDNFIATKSGTYTVYISNTSGVCSSLIATSTVTINALPTVSVNSPAVCVGSSATVTASPTPTGGTYTYLWTYPVTDPGNVSSFSTTDAGTYSVVITDTTTGCSSTSSSGIVTINALPTVTVNSPTVCQGTNAVVTAVPSPTGTYTYTWTYPVTATNPGNVNQFIAIVSGNYGVTVTNTATGCTSLSATSTVTINANPTVSVTGDSVCQGVLATITANATPSSGTYNYVWTVQSGPAIPNVSTFTTAIGGTYSVIITDTTTGCSSTSQSGVATIVPAFDFVITDGCLDNIFNVNVVPLNNSFDANTASYSWQVGGVTVSGEVNATFDVSHYMATTTPTPSLPLTVTSTVVSTQTCSVTHSIVLDRIYCNIQKGISPNNDGKNDNFDLRLLGVQQLSIFNRYGTKVYTKTDYSNEWVGQSDAGNELPDGTYYYVIEFKNNQPSKTGWIYINIETK